MAKKDITEIKKIENDIFELLKTVMDPEIEIDIINLGLVYNILYDGEHNVRIEMTLSTPACPLADAITDNVENVLKARYKDFDIEIDVVFEPLWDASMISEEGRKMLNM